MVPGTSVSATVLPAMSSEGAAYRSVSSATWPAPTSLPWSISFEPALFTMSGGVELAKRGCRTVEISSVCENLTSACGNFALYDGMWTSVAYLVPRPPLKMTTSRGAFGSTPSGLSAVLAPVADVVGSLPPPTQALRRPTAGVASTPARAARRKTDRRVRSGVFDISCLSSVRVRRLAGDRRSATRGCAGDLCRSAPAGAVRRPDGKGRAVTRQPPRPSAEIWQRLLTVTGKSSY